MAETSDAQQAADARKGKGKAFFDRADQVAETGNWDFAIEMYTEGIKREPEDIERGHKPLREIALKRKLAGGKKAGMMDSLKHGSSKDSTENLANAEYLLAKDPGNVQLMVNVLNAATKLECEPVVDWIADIILDSQRQAKKPNVRVLRKVMESYESIEEYHQALEACRLARQLNPDDEFFAGKEKELGALDTLKAGRYGEQGDFKKSVKNMDEQVKLAQADQMVQNKSFVEQQIENARAEYTENPTVPAKVMALVDVLTRTEDPSYENEAIDILNKAWQDTKNYQFKVRMGDIRIKQMTRRYRKLVQEGDKEAAAEQARNQLAFELEEYAERAANYPTDLGIKYELGRRQFLAGQLDDAIGSLQQAQRDPRRQRLAMTYLGQAFAKKGWYTEAAETFERALEMELTEEQSKELRYYLGDALENMGQYKKAQEQFSAVAQTDYNFKDVRDRLEAARQKAAEQEE
jgi:tetratricopeptide (TPR) repeat protein